MSKHRFLVRTHQARGIRIGDIMRLATAAAMMLLGSISSVIAQPTPSPSESPTSSTSQSPTPSPPQAQTPSVQSSEPQDCIFADSRFSEGAQFCVTSQQALKCENGRWSPVTMYCGGEQTLRSEDHGYRGNEDHGYRGNEDHGYRGNEDQGYRGNEDHGDCQRQL
jgi:hypothetical protein